MNGISCSRVRDTAKDEAFSSKFHLLRARTSERGELAVTTVRKRAVEDAAACSTAWDAARHGVPVRRLRELMEKTLHKTRSAWRRKQRSSGGTAYFVAVGMRPPFVFVQRSYSRGGVTNEIQ